jgi:hypothetical protein
MEIVLCRQGAEPTTKSEVEKYIAPNQLQLNVVPSCKPPLLKPIYENPELKSNLNKVSFSIDQ